MGFYYILCALTRMLSKMPPLTGFRSAGMLKIPDNYGILGHSAEMNTATNNVRIFLVKWRQLTTIIVREVYGGCKSFSRR